MNKTKGTIFESAIKVFSIYGYDGATMDEIASQAGVAKGTLYYHFKSKEEIFKYIIQRGMDLIKQRVDEVVKEKDNSIEKLKAVCKVQLSMVYENRDFFKVIMSQLWGQELRQLQLRENIQQFIQDIESYLQEAIKDGFIRKGEKSFMAYSMFGMLCSAAVYELINENHYNIDEVVENLMNYILKGIEA
ncbi:AcrR family transcriptional regulator [Clostridium tetanomorphum]|uniref:TetR/AcrR family transcriptional regulator n=1 Tax=Clostridium tetanomorphum TaxID=1553 RepID=A0A923EDB4_CLOTT|nr:TetR/AcrR family transcriptional regulator [Clostridium tetanomorphum]KAJ50812.1 TetR family transcriptional regulator [Clostridium tetanomorphum DSM 665]MBC2399951.1 TetR/AcrR family transcriptional regulator [Clostridium tetanomorphum]MBP1866463.1 AcrR family transcriptional regulator [Clostridium tetanomorphum]NRS86650.1 AcrR family transcriptional regulator [Clostridium tetanomorphum]NRZ95346.1 AcrR family transcriptional regulator [Clostridium tetanomorphum]